MTGTETQYFVGFGLKQVLLGLLVVGVVIYLFLRWNDR
jgi:hypothetical protein